MIFQKTDQVKFDTHTENIGIGGICVILGKRLRNFMKVEMILYLKDGHPPIECNGSIVWAIERDKSGFDTGIEFSDLKEEHRGRVNRIVEDHLKQENA